MSIPVLINHYAPQVTSRIDNSGDEWGDNSILRISVKGVNDYLGFTVQGMPEETKLWFQDILTKQFEEVAKKSFELGRQSIIKNLKELLELK